MLSGDSKQRYSSVPFVNQIVTMTIRLLLTHQLSHDLIINCYQHYFTIIETDERMKVNDFLTNKMSRQFYRNARLCSVHLPQENFTMRIN